MTFYALPCGIHEASARLPYCPRCPKLKQAIAAELDACISEAQERVLKAQRRHLAMVEDDHAAWLAKQPSKIRKLFAQLETSVPAFTRRYTPKRKTRWPDDVVVPLKELSRVHSVPLMRIAALTGLTYSAVYTHVNASGNRALPVYMKMTSAI